MENKCKKCYENDKTPDENDCKKCQKVIIDGIDVSGCAFYSKGKCNNPNGMACNCRNNAICYYKELKRLELKNKELKELIKTYKTGLCDCTRNAELEEENVKLKEALENVRSYLKLTGVLWDNELLLDTNTQRAVDVINEVLKDE